MKENVTKINSVERINVNMSVKNVMGVKNIMFGILLHVVQKIKNIYQGPWMIQQLRVMK